MSSRPPVFIALPIPADLSRAWLAHERADLLALLARRTGLAPIRSTIAPSERDIEATLLDVDASILNVVSRHTGGKFWTVLDDDGKSYPEVVQTLFLVWQKAHGFTQRSFEKACPGTIALTWEKWGPAFMAAGMEREWAAAKEAPIGGETMPRLVPPGSMEGVTFDPAYTVGADGVRRYTHVGVLGLKPAPLIIPFFRPEVCAFAKRLEARLAEKDPERGATWKDMPKEELAGQVMRHARALLVASGDAVLREAVDVANYAMMVADVGGFLDAHGAETEGAA